MSMSDKNDYWRCKCGEIYYWVNNCYCPKCEQRPLKKEMISLDQAIINVKKKMSKDLASLHNSNNLHKVK